MIAAHKVVMDTIRTRLMLLVAPPSFQAPSPSSFIVDEFKELTPKVYTLGCPRHRASISAT